MVSVIVPVYNVEKYISECIESILMQSYTDFELLLVDDGSTDNSGIICDEYANKDSRIKVFHKPNGGLSSARNKGLDEAKGEFICFVDSDDTVDRTFLESLYDGIMSYNCDLAFCDIFSSKLPPLEEEAKTTMTFSVTKAINWLCDTRSREYILMVVSWNKMYCKRLFEGLRFPEGKLHEDEFMITPILMKCSKIAYICESLYVYRENENGITSEADRMNLRHLDGVDALVQRTELAIQYGDKQFAVISLKNALYKCARFYKDAIQSGVPDMQNASLKKYRDIFLRWKNIFTPWQRIKYTIGIIFPKLFYMIFNP